MLRVYENHVVFFFSVSSGICASVHHLYGVSSLTVFRVVFSYERTQVQCVKQYLTFIVLINIHNNASVKQIFYIFADDY